MSVITVRAANAPMSTSIGEYFMAMSAVANMDLSPNSDRNTTPNDSVNGRTVFITDSGIGSRDRPDGIAKPAPAPPLAVEVANAPGLRSATTAMSANTPAMARRA